MKQSVNVHEKDFNYFFIARTKKERRKFIDTKYLYYGKCIDRRSAIRRKEEQVDEVALERQRYIDLGPGWL